MNTPNRQLDSPRTVFLATNSTFQGRRFNNNLIFVDTNRFFDCEFISCVIKFKGGLLPTLSGCLFVRCGFELEGAAQRTLQFLNGHYRAGLEGRQFVQTLIDDVKSSNFFAKNQDVLATDPEVVDEIDISIPRETIKGEKFENIEVNLDGISF